MLKKKALLKLVCVPGFSTFLHENSQCQMCLYATYIAMNFIIVQFVNILLVKYKITESKSAALQIKCQEE